MFENRRRNKVIVLFCLYFIAGIFLRLYYLNQFEASPLFHFPLGADVKEYASWANEIIAGKFLWDEVNIHSPLYPYFLAFSSTLFSYLESPYFWIRFFQLIIGLFSVIPLFLSLKIIYKNSREDELLFKKSSIISFLFLWLIYPPLIYYLSELTSEVLLVPLLSIGIFSLYKWEESEGEGEEGGKLQKKSLLWLACAGIFSGLAVITHPLSLFFIISEAIYLSFKICMKRYRKVIKKQFLSLIIYATSAMIPILPIVIYNTVVLGDTAPIQANSGFNLYLGNGPEADGTCRLRPGPEWDKIHSEAEKKSEKLGISKDQYFINKTLHHIKTAPFEWIKLLSKKALYVWNHREITAGADLEPIRYFTAFQRYTKWAFGLCATLALIAILLNIGPDILKRGKNRFFSRYRHFLIIIIAFWAAQTLLVTSGRYRVGMLPSILILSAAGISSITSLLLKLRKRSLLIIPSIAMALLIVFLPSTPFHPEREKGEALTLYGEAYLRKGELPEAENCLIYALETHPGWTRNYNLLGMVCEKQYKFDAAETLYKKAIKIAPEDPVAYVNLATLYSSRNLKGLAKEYFNKSFKLKKRNPELHYNYALFCENNKEEAKAIKHYNMCLNIDPSYHQALNNLGIIAFNKNNFKAAIIYFKKALRIDPRNAPKLLNLSSAYLRNGSLDKALKTLNRARAVNPNINQIETIRKLIEEELEKEKSKRISK